MDLSSEHKILDLKNRIEASIVIWKRKMNQKDGKSPWGSAVSLEKRELFEERAETILLILKHRFPGIPQSALDISKIQYNRVNEISSFIFFLLQLFLERSTECFSLFMALQDVGQALLESYSRILESLAFTVMSRIEDVLYADYVAQNPSFAEQKRSLLRETPMVLSPTTDDGAGTPTSRTLSDFMGWSLGENENDGKKDSSTNEFVKEDWKFTEKLANIVTIKKPSYLENLGGLRSPTARH